MTQPTFDNIPIADMDNVFLLNIDQGSWKYGYVFNGDFYVHRHYQKGTYNKVRAGVVKYINSNLPIPDWGSNWEHVHTNNLDGMDMYGYTSGLRMSIGQLQQAKAMAMVSSQIAEETPYKLSNDSSTVLGKPDEEIMAAIAAGVVKQRPAVNVEVTTETNLVSGVKEPVVKTEDSGSHCEYYHCEVKHPQNPNQKIGYIANCEDIIQALGLTFDEGCEFKSIWRRGRGRQGFVKAESTPLRDAIKAVHYSTRVLRFEEQKAGNHE